MMGTLCGPRDILNALDALSAPIRHELAGYPAALVARMKSRGLVETCEPVGVIWITRKGWRYLDAGAELCPWYYVAGIARDAANYPMIRCQARTLPEAKGEAYRILADRHLGHIVRVGMARHGKPASPEPIWLASRVIGEPRWFHAGWLALKYTSLPLNYAIPRRDYTFLSLN